MAVDAARKAFIYWSKLTKSQRYDHIMNLADLVEKYFDELVKAESKDNGKPEWLASLVDIPRASENFRFLQQLHYILIQKYMKWMERL